MVRRLADAFAVPTDRPPLQFDNSAAIWLAGFVSVADWLGSDETSFPYAGDEVATLSLDTYAGVAADRARAALALRGWRGFRERPRPLMFADLFPAITANPMQTAVQEIGAAVTGPGLMVVEAPMGEGKTEAALALVERWGVAAGGPTCYIALPTQATSDQMFSRVRDFLSRVYDDERTNLQLLHGHAALSAEFAAMRGGIDWHFVPAGVDGPQGYDQAPAGVIAAEWFTHRKRGLLAPFGVGTIDQVLLGALQTRHGFVRLWGLAGKTIVFDEVHAYDAYMSALLERLLAWLGALGSPVVLLSATLPAERRRRLVAAYAAGIGQPPPDLPATPYPRLSWLSAGGAGARHVPVSARGTKRVRLEWVDGRAPMDGEPFPLGEQLGEALAGGGCAAVICNTVARAQAVHQALRPYFPDTAADGSPELDLLHARFLYGDRQDRQQRALGRFGKAQEDGETSRRPRRAVLVATQVIEQSLDLDFDLMVSDPAPIDLVLQRLGRLHRHPRAGRPFNVAAPVLWLCRPEAEADEPPIFESGTKAVYDPHILLRSWLLLRDRGWIDVPGAIGNWIEHVYDVDDEGLLEGGGVALRREWEATKRRLLVERRAEEEQAAERWIKPPSYGGQLWHLMAEPREEEAPEFHPAHRALTRLTERTVSLICLDAAEAAAVSTKATPSLDRAKWLLQRSVTVGDKRVVGDLLRTQGPTGWARSALLRHHRLVILTDGRSEAIGRWQLLLDEELGLRVIEAGTEGVNDDLRPRRRAMDPV